MEDSRLPIKQIGTVTFKPDGSIDADGWGFHQSVAPYEVYEITPVDGKLAGWSAEELHNIAHGSPCACRANA